MGVSLFLSGSDAQRIHSGVLIVAGVIGAAIGSILLGLNARSVTAAAFATALSTLWALIVAFTANGATTALPDVAPWTGFAVVAVSLAWLFAASLRSDGPP
jgi:predicted MFS family arabinose efflux permease